MNILQKYTGASFPIGIFSFDQAAQYDDEGFLTAKEMGADYIVAAPADELFLSLCEKHGLYLIANDVVSPLWWGGDGQNAGRYKDAFPVARLDEIAKTYPPSAQHIGDYLLDEPNAKDFAHMNAVVRRYRALFPGKLPFINLYPNYASIPKNTGEEVAFQLGTASYEEHIGRYVKEVDLPYLCFDYYPFTGNVINGFLDNLNVASEACRKSHRELWVIIQTGAWKQAEMLARFQIAWQANMCLAYGATSIIHACYNHRWWDDKTCAIDAQGHKNITYDYAKHVNAALKHTGAQAAHWTYAGTTVVGSTKTAEPRLKPQLEAQRAYAKSRGLPDCGIASDAACVVGLYARDGAAAAMVVNARDPFDEGAAATITITPPDGRRAVVYGASGMIPCGNALRIASGDGVFVAYA
jgi:hypothetical protein